MMDKRAAIQEKTQKILSVRRNQVVLGVIIFFVIIVLPIVFSIVGMNNSIEKGIRIDNFSDYFPDYSDKERRKIEVELYKKVAASKDLNINTIPESGALIQPDSLYSFILKPSFSYNDFIVDISSIEKTYRIRYINGRVEGSQEIEDSVSAAVFDINDPGFIRFDPIDFLTPVEFEDLFCILKSTTSSETTSGRAIVAILDPPESVYLTGGVGNLKNQVNDKISSYLSSFGISVEDYKIVFRFEIVQ